MDLLLEEIRRCTICAGILPHHPRPFLSASKNSRILIIGQAPGRIVHETGVPWDDKSGETLRQWLAIPDATFYDPNMIGLIPMGFCYPGKGKSGDLPPRPECAIAWHEKLFSNLSNVKLTILIGQYAQAKYLKEKAKKNLTETVRNFEAYLPSVIPLPHPSPRNRFWLKKNPWFEEELLPVLKSKVNQIAS